jgi:curved DNA-binding protein CbpA
MTDYFALLGEARRPFLDPEKLKEKYFALSRAEAPGAEMNEAYRVLSEPKLRLQHLLQLEGADLAAGRPVPPAVAELFWNTGALLREIERLLLRQAETTSTLARALLLPERAKLEARLLGLEKQLRGKYDEALAELAGLPNELAGLIERYDTISYLTRLLEQVGEKRLRLEIA